MIASERWTRRRLATARRLAQRSKVPIRDTAWDTGARFVDLVVGLASLALLARSIGVADYGLFVGLFGLIGPISNLNQAGVQMAAIEYISRAEEDAEGVFGSMTAWAMGFGLLAAPAVVLLADELVAGVPTLAVIAVALQELVFNAGFSTSRATVVASVGFGAASRLYIGVGLSRLVLLVGLWFAGITLTRYAIGLFFIYVVWWLVSLAYLQRVGIGIGWVTPAWRHLRSMLVYGIGLFSSGVQASSDRTVLTAAGFEREAGAYGAAYRLFELSRAPLMALAGATHVELVRGSTAPWDRVRRTVHLSLVSAAYSVIAAGGLIVISPLLQVLLGEDFSEASTVLRWLAPIAVLRSTNVFPANALVGLGRNGDRTIIQVVIAALAVTLYVTLIPGRGWEGAVVATAIAEAATLVVMWSVVVLRAHQAATIDR